VLRRQKLLGPQRRRLLLPQTAHARPSETGHWRQIQLAPRAKGHGGQHHSRSRHALYGQRAETGHYHQPARHPVAHDHRPTQGDAFGQSFAGFGSFRGRNRLYGVVGGRHFGETASARVRGQRQRTHVQRPDGRTARVQHFHRPGLLPAAQAHGGGQTAQPFDGANGEFDAAAGRGAGARRRPQVRRNGARLHDFARGVRVHQGARVRRVGQVPSLCVQRLRHDCGAQRREQHPLVPELQQPRRLHAGQDSVRVQTAHPRTHDDERHAPIDCSLIAQILF